MFMVIDLDNYIYLFDYFDEIVVYIYRNDVYVNCCFIFTIFFLLNP